MSQIMIKHKRKVNDVMDIIGPQLIRVMFISKEVVRNMARKLATKTHKRCSNDVKFVCMWADENQASLVFS